MIDINTYRYLMSALSQVFAALVAVNAVFLVLRYESIIRHRGRVLKTLSLFTQIINASGQLELNGTDTSILKRSQIHSEYFQALSESHKYERIEKAETTLKKDVSNFRKENKIEKLNESEYELNLFEYYKNWYEIINTVISGFPQFVGKSLGIPSIICLLFVLLLSITEFTNSINLLWWNTVCSILLVTVGLFSIIYYAIKAFDRNEPKMIVLKNPKS